MVVLHVKNVQNNVSDMEQISILNKVDVNGTTMEVLNVKNVLIVS